MRHNGCLLLEACFEAPPPSSVPLFFVLAPPCRCSCPNPTRKPHPIHPPKPALRPAAVILGGIVACLVVFEVPRPLKDMLYCESTRAGGGGGRLRIGAACVARACVARACGSAVQTAITTMRHDVR